MVSGGSDKLSLGLLSFLSTPFCASMHTHLPGTFCTFSYVSDSDRDRQSSPRAFPRVVSLVHPGKAEAVGWWGRQWKPSS